MAAAISATLAAISSSEISTFSISGGTALVTACRLAGWVGGEVAGGPSYDGSAGERDGPLAVPVVDQRPQGVDVRGRHGAVHLPLGPRLEGPGAQRGAEGR